MADTTGTSDVEMADAESHTEPKNPRAFAPVVTPRDEFFCDVLLDMYKAKTSEGFTYFDPSVTDPERNRELAKGYLEEATDIENSVNISD